MSTEREFDLSQSQTLSMSDVGRALGVDASTVNRRIRNGQLRLRLLPGLGSRRVSRVELERYLSGEQAESA